MKYTLLFLLTLVISVQGYAGLHPSIATAPSSSRIRYADSVIAFSSQYDSSNNAAREAVGYPNIYPNHRNDRRAWASASPDNQREFLELWYDKPAPISYVAVFETYNPGAVDTIYVKNPGTGMWEVVWSDTAQPITGDTARILEVSFPLTSFAVSEIRIAINSPAVPGFNEIDAVGISDTVVTPTPTPFAASVIAFSSEYSASGWSARQATWFPDVYPLYGDIASAWASASPDSQREFLELRYSDPIPINHVAIYETYNPGAVDTIYVKNPGTGMWEVVWSDTAQPITGDTARILEVSFPLTSFAVSDIRIAINSPAVPDWNEIDAIAISATPDTTLGITYIDVQPSWNMLSIPYRVADYQKTVLYPTATSPAYNYANGVYASQAVLQNRKGYWLKYPASTTLSYTGMIIPQETVAVSKGWNMVGTPSTRVLRSTVVPVGTTIQPNMYGYTSGVGYYIEDTLKPGLGYWAKASANGQLILNGSFNVPKVPMRPDPLGGLSCISITDAVGNKQNLYLGTDSPNEPGDFELPPVPPGGIFDARFASQRIAEFLGDEESKELPILVSSAEYPVSMSIELHGLRASVVVNKKEIPIPNSRKVEIPGGSSRILLRIVKGEESPTRFGLEQNYPNPFNPVTSIEYRVASSEYVSLKVYDVLGREVATLVNEIRQPGTYTVTWDARQTDGGRAVSMASGVYFYCLHAGSFIETKKLVLTK